MQLYRHGHSPRSLFFLVGVSSWSWLEAASPTACCECGYCGNAFAFCCYDDSGYSWQTTANLITSVQSHMAKGCIAASCHPSQRRMHWTGDRHCNDALHSSGGTLQGPAHAPSKVPFPTGSPIWYNVHWAHTSVYDAAKMLRLWRLRQSTNASINSWPLSVNHALISPILTHLVIWSSGIFSIGSIDSPLSSSITTSLFHSRLKTFLFWKSFPP